MASKKKSTLTRAERRWAFKHAKEHFIEAMKDILTDEHHSMIQRNGVTRDDIHAEVMGHLERWFRQVRKEKMPP